MKTSSIVTTMARVHRILGVSLVALGISACAAGVGENDDDSVEGDVQVEASETFTRTIVRLEGDGREIVEVQVVTRAEQLMAQEQRARMLESEREGFDPATAIVKDSGCASSSMWIFDQPNLHGNEICFTGAGDANLYNYCRISQEIVPGTYVCTDRWNNDVRSYWAGSDGGLFSFDLSFVCTGGGSCGIFAP